MEIVVRCFDNTRFTERFVHIETRTGTESALQRITVNEVKSFLLTTLRPKTEQETEPQGVEGDEAILKAFKLFNLNSESVLMVDKYVGTLSVKTPLELVRQLNDEEDTTKLTIYFDILPKCYRTESWSEVDINRLTQMASTVPKMLNRVAEKKYDTELPQALIPDKGTPLLGFYLVSFFESVSRIVERGLLRRYVKREGNEKFLKGRLLVNQNIMQNAFRPERFVTCFEELSEDIPENRLISAALLQIQHIDFSSELMARLNDTFNDFAFIEFSTDIVGDFERIEATEPELPNDYRTALWWSRLILNQEGLAMAKGDSRNVTSFLIDMNELFEHYLEKVLMGRLQRNNGESNLSLSFQNQTLFGKWQGNSNLDYVTEIDAFKLRPDVLVKNGNENAMVLDAKWKLFDANDDRVSIDKISVADARQFYAYQAYFRPSSNVAVLICPKTPNLMTWNVCKFELPSYTDQNNSFYLVVLPYDLEHERFIELNDKKNECSEIIEEVQRYFNLR